MMTPTILLISQGIIHLVRPQNFRKNLTFLPPDMHTYVPVSGCKKYSFLETFANVLNE